MGAYDSLESCGKFFNIDGIWESVKGGLLIVASVWIKPLACEIYAQLGLG